MMAEFRPYGENVLGKERAARMRLLKWMIGTAG
jgi:hypothetical protein